MNRRTYLKFKQLGIIICAWLIVGLVITIYDHLVISTSNSLGFSPEYSFTFSALRNMGGGFIGALLGGSFLIFFINVKYQDKPYGYTILAVSISFILIIAFISAIMGTIIVPLHTGKSLSDPISQEAFLDFLTDWYPIKAALSWSFVVAVTQLLLQVKSKFGQSAFWDIVHGKYNTPKVENRIFMFLDLNSSTAIAEHLGNEKYHSFLKDFFADITNPILDHHGEIYQYVGDEIVVGWKYPDGIKNNNCIGCFFDIKIHIEKKKEEYLNRYGIAPSFKAGIHCGQIVAGEVGIIKRDITYSGDVLNTTSRILGMCKEFNEEIIASEKIIDKLHLNLNNFTIKALGLIKLRGKEIEMMLCAVKPQSK